MSDLVLIAKPGYAFAGGTTGPAFLPTNHITGSHGYVASDTPGKKLSAILSQ